LVGACNTHTCTAKCKRTVKRGLPCATCKSGFPNKSRNASAVFVSNPNTGCRQVEPTRDCDHVNVFCPVHTYLWRANMDIQYIHFSFGVATYVASYVSKQEHSEVIPWNKILSNIIIQRPELVEAGNIKHILYQVGARSFPQCCRCCVYSLYMLMLDPHCIFRWLTQNTSFVRFRHKRRTSLRRSFISRTKVGALSKSRTR
jgi:hypothetical protein